MSFTSNKSHSQINFNQLYPQIIENNTTLKFESDRTIVIGTCCGSLTLDQSLSFSKSAPKQVVLTKSPAHDLLTYIDFMSGVICESCDPSSHFAVVCRSLGVPIASVSPDTFAQITKYEEQKVAINTLSSEILIGDVSIDDESHKELCRGIIENSSKSLNFSLTSNADTAADVAKATEYGFKKFWPRSEIMLYAPEILNTFRALLIEETPDLVDTFRVNHQAALKKLLNSAKRNRLVLRLLDPPAHEFLPSREDSRSIKEIAKLTGLSSDDVLSQLESLEEDNPMIGHRGSRLLLTRPALLEAQVRAMCDAWLELAEAQRPQYVEIFVPFIVTAAELAFVKKQVIEIIQTKTKLRLDQFSFGTMVETSGIMDQPEQIAELVDFVSFGTNDLTATHYALSRGDCYSAYMDKYIEWGLFKYDPFEELTDELVDIIIKFTKRLREAKPDIEIDTCGEHSVGYQIWKAIDAGAYSSISIGGG